MNNAMSHDGVAIVMFGIAARVCVVCVVCACFDLGNCVVSRPSCRSVVIESDHFQLLKKKGRVLP